MAPKKQSKPPVKGQRSITMFLAGSPGAKDAKEPAPPPPKRARTGGSSGGGSSMQQQQTSPLPRIEAGGIEAVPPSAGPAPAPRQRVPAATPAGNRQALQQKLGLTGEAAAAAAGAALPIEPAQPAAGASGSGAGGRRGSAAAAVAGSAKLTPLEQQVAALKQAHPGVLLCVEVGYKFRLFGADAEAGAAVLGIYAFQDRSYLTAGFPTYRLHYHVRRLVLAGHKVGVVRQIETAAIKKAGDNRSGPFERKLTALYTKATLEAGELGGVFDSEAKGQQEEGREEEEEREEGREQEQPGLEARGSGRAGSGAEEEAAAAGQGEGRRRQAAASASTAPPQQQQQQQQQQRGGWRRLQQLAQQAPSSYLVCCVEEPVKRSGGGGGGGGAAAQVEVGLVAVEPSTGAVLHTQFKDGLMRQELESKLLFAAPAEILLAEPASVETRRLVAGIGEQLAGAPRIEAVTAAPYRLASTALDAVQAFYGTRHGGTDGGGGGGSSASPGGFPVAAAAAAGDAAGSAAGQESSQHQEEGGGGEARAAALAAVRALPPLVLRALAHLLDYLRPFGLEAVLRLGAAFQPWDQAQEMRLSANTLRQLEIFQCSNSSPRGSLVGMMDHCKTKFGRRLLHSWVGKPLRQAAAINARLDAVQELSEQGEGHPVLSRLVPALRKLPDLERGITRAFHATIRPSELVTLLQQFQTLHQQLGLQADTQAASPTDGPGTSTADADATAVGAAEGSSRSAAVPPPPVHLRGVRSALLQQLLAAAGDLSVAAAATQMLAAMDLEAAAANNKADVLKPSDRFPAVVRLRAEVAAAQRALSELLPQYRRTLQISNLQFISLQNQGDFLLEVPPDLVKRVPKDWVKVSSVKKGVRYHTPEVRAGLERLALAQEHLKAACDAAWKHFLADFGAHYLRLRAAVQALAALDCLCGLATLASSPGYCRPELLGSDQPPQLCIEAGRHPVLELLLEGRGSQFVPNNTQLRGDGTCCQIITGPNMGGKSCYSRQCALIAIMAQVGSFVPAAAARLRPLDAVLTRMGASDSLALGRSTFAEELGETSSIVSSATPSSLVILDELGRGTSTGDGAAIAEATLRHLVQAVRPLTLFITHYPEVCFRLEQALPGAVACYRMAHVEEEGQQGAQRPQQEQGQGEGQEEGGGAAPQQQQQQQQRAQQAALGRVVFLFKLVRGVAPASFGINVARMAQLPEVVLQRAAQVAARVQQESEERRRRQQPALGSSGDAEERAVQLAQQCQQFVQRSLLEGEVDVETGRRLQAEARELLSA